MKKIISKSELNSMLPDYAFGKLSDNDRKIFEENIGKYPDMVDEIDDIKSVFSKIDKSRIQSNISVMSRNLSVEVGRRMSKPRRKSGYAFVRYTMAALGAVLVIFLYQFNTGNISNDTVEVASAEVFPSDLIDLALDIQLSTSGYIEYLDEEALEGIMESSFMDESADASDELFYDTMDDEEIIEILEDVTDDFNS